MASEWKSSLSDSGLGIRVTMIGEEVITREEFQIATLRRLIYVIPFSVFLFRLTNDKTSLPVGASAARHGRWS